MAPIQWRPLAAAATAAAALVFVAVAAAGAPAVAAAPPPTHPPRVTQFWVVNATTGGWVSRLRNGATVTPATSGPYAIAAVSTAGTAWPVVWTSPPRYAHVDRRPPYALAWDRPGGTFQPVRLRPGAYTLSAFVAAPAAGDAGPGGGGVGPPLMTSITFTVTLPRVAAFWVMGADWGRRTNGQRLAPLRDGSVIDTAATGQWSIEAEAPAVVGPALRVRFTSPAVVLEQRPPYMLGRNYPSAIFPLSLPPGVYTVAANMEDWLGARGETVAVTFTVVDGAAA